MTSTSSTLGFVSVVCGENGLVFDVVCQTPSGPETRSVEFQHHSIVRSPNADICTCDTDWTGRMYEILQDPRRDLDKVTAERTVPMRKKILLNVPQIKGNASYPVCCIPKFLKREEVGWTNVSGTLFVCSSVHGDSPVFGCFLSDLARAADLELSTARSRIKAIVKELGVARECAFPKTRTGRVVVTIDMLPEILRASEDTNFGTADLVLNAVSYYEKYFVTGNMRFDMNTVRFAILALKGECVFTNMARSFARIARELKVQHQLTESVSRRADELEREIKQLKWNFYKLDNQRRERMAAEVNISARVAKNADMLALILQRVDEGQRQGVFARHEPRTEEGRSRKRFSTMLTKRFAEIAKNGFEPYKPQPNAASVLISKTVQELASLPQDARLEDGLEHATDDVWVLEHPEGSSGTSYDKNCRKIAKALGVGHTPLTTTEKALFNLRDKQCRAAHAEPTRKRSADPPTEQPEPKRTKPLSTNTPK